MSSEYEGISLRSERTNLEKKIGEFEFSFFQDYFPNLCNTAMNGLRESSVRSLYWKVFLGVLNGKPEQWVEQIQQQRVKYEQLIDKHTIDPRKEQGDINIFNPLSTETSNPWQHYFENSELEKLINQDLIRLYPEYDFFKNQFVQEQMRRALFIWSKENPNPSYRQGMHELLGPIYFVVYRDAVTAQERDRVLANETLNQTKVQLVCQLMDEKYIEHDAYAIFAKLMNKMKDFFEVTKFERKDRKHVTLFGDEDMKLNDPLKSTQLYIVCNRIQNLLLRSKDPELTDHLTELGDRKSVV